MLVSIEGIDGSGKTTVWEALRGSLADAARETTFTREPTDSWYGDAVRRSVADDDADPLAELFLYTADHAAHLANTVRPALAAGDLVVTDRYVDSRCAYQGVALDGVVSRPLEYVSGVHRPFTRMPDLTLLVEVDPAVGAARSGGKDKFEREAFLREVAEKYDFLASREPDRFVRIDGEQSPEAVVEEAEAAVREALASADAEGGGPAGDEGTDGEGGHGDGAGA
ncbi:MAG: dTMP kinase [Halobacteriaceae archaeon]